MKTKTSFLVSSVIRLPADAALSDEGCALKKQLTYKNPQYAIARTLGFSTHSIPPELFTYEQFEDKGLQVYRGEILKVMRHFPEAKWETAFPNHPACMSFTSPFELDEHQENAIAQMQKHSQGLVLAVTSAGKTTMILKAAAGIGQKTLILVHRKILLEQFLEAIKTHLRKPDGSPVVPGIIGDGKFKVGDEITVAIEKSFVKHPELFSSFGCVFVDEVHLAPATVFTKIVNGLNAKHRYGLTGTLKRKDGKQFLVEAMFGSTLAEINKEDLLELDRVSPVDLAIVPTAAVLPENYDPGDKNPWQDVEKTLAADMAREDEILEYTENLLHDPLRKVIILCRFVKQTERLQAKLAERIGSQVGIVIGGRKDQKEQCDMLESGITRALVATVSTISTGVNIPSLTDIILTAPIFNNHALLGQIRGRLMRKSSEKTHGTLHFIWDGNVYEAYSLTNLKRIFKK